MEWQGFGSSRGYVRAGGSSQRGQHTASGGRSRADPIPLRHWAVAWPCSSGLQQHDTSIKNAGWESCLEGKADRQMV